MESRAYAGGIADIVNQQAHRPHCIGGQGFAHDHRRVTIGTVAAATNPIRLFVTHTWEESEDYGRVFEYLESPGTFYYRNTSLPGVARQGGAEAEREELRRQIAPSEVVVFVPGAWRRDPDLVLFQLNFAKAAGRPIVAMEQFGSNGDLPRPIAALADEISAWNERDLIDALRRRARNVQTSRWETIEFKLD